MNQSQIGGANGYVEERWSRVRQFESHWNNFLYQSKVESCVILFVCLFDLDYLRPTNNLSAIKGQVFLGEAVLS